MSPSFNTTTLLVLMFAIASLVPVYATRCPALGTASNFVAGSYAGVSSAGISNLVGGVAVYPIANAITGFAAGAIHGPIESATSVASLAMADAATAYGCLSAHICGVNLSGQDLGGKILLPNVYCFDAAAAITGTLTLDARGDANAIWIFKTGSTLLLATSATVHVINGGTPGNVFWRIGSSGTVMTNAVAVGNHIAYASMTFVDGSTLHGRAFGLNGAITMVGTHMIATGCTTSMCR